MTMHLFPGYFIDPLLLASECHLPCCIQQYNNAYYNTAQMPECLGLCIQKLLESWTETRFLSTCVVGQ